MHWISGNALRSDPFESELSIPGLDAWLLGEAIIPDAPKVSSIIFTPNEGSVYISIARLNRFLPSQIRTVTYE